MDGWTSTIIIVSIFIGAYPIALLWEKYIGWHAEMEVHKWLRFAYIIPAGLGLPFFVSGHTGVAYSIWISGIVIAVFLDLVVGAKCSECGRKLRCHGGRYGPLRYTCETCNLEWYPWGR